MRRLENISIHPCETPTPNVWSGTRFVPQEHVPFSLGMILLMVFMFISIGRIQETIPVLAALRIVLVTGGLAVYLWLLTPVSWQEKLPLKDSSVRYVLLLLALAFVTIPSGLWPSRSLDIALAHTKTVLFFLMVLSWAQSLVDIRRLIWACCFSVTGLAAIGMLFPEASWDQRLSAGGSSYDPNDLALVLVIMLPMLVYLLSTTTGTLKRFLVGAMAFLCLLSIVRSGSRGGFIAFVATAALILFRSAISRTHKVIIVIFALVVFVGMTDQAYWDRMSAIWAPANEYERTGSGRTDLWKTGMRLMVERPWGVGIGSFEVAEGYSHGGAGAWRAAHNSFIQLGVELGVVGLIIFLLLLLRTLANLRSIRSKHGMSETVAATEMRDGDHHERDIHRNVSVLASALHTSILAFMVGGFFVSHAYSQVLYALLALSLACYRLANQANSSAESPDRAQSDFAYVVPAKTSQPMQG